MKNPRRGRKANRIFLSKPQGFALVISLSLMVLLTVLAVGLLGLSTISLRTSSRGDANAVAKANARLALAIAIGELQKHAGPDTRITATGAIMDQAVPSKSPVTGVWESRRFDAQDLPAASDYEKFGGKQNKFRKWLVSSAEAAATEEMDFVTSGEFPDKERATLVPELKAAGETIDPVHGGLVPVADATGTRTGSYAYAVLDDGVKARIDTGFQSPAQTRTGDLAATLGSGVRADASRIPGLEKLDWEAADLALDGGQLRKAVTFSSGDLMLEQLGGKGGDAYSVRFHDVTTESLGIFSDVANGGLKQDLNSILNAPVLPTDLAGTANAKAYTKHLGYNVPASAALGQLEPSWEQLHNFANLHAKSLKDARGPTLPMQPPVGWTMATQPPPATSKNAPLMPSLLKMQMFYSLIAVPMWKSGNFVNAPNTQPPEKNWTEPEGGHVGWQRIAWAKGARYFMVLCMMPCITLHNPYNTNLEVRDLAVELSNVPMAIQVSRRMGGGGTGWLPADGQGVDMVDSQVRGTSGRKFLFNLTGTGNATNFTMAPGEICVFSPTAPANANYLDNPYRSWNNFTDPSKAQPMVLAKGFRGVTIGFYAPRISGNELEGYETYPGGRTGRGSLEYLAPRDSMRVKVRPCLDKRIGTNEVPRGKCRVSLIRAGTSGAAPQLYSTAMMDVGTSESGNLLNGLEKALGTTGEELDWVTATEMAGTSGDQPLNAMKAYTFGIMTISGKTTHGKFQDKKDDGAVAAKPLAFHGPATTYTSADVTKHGVEPYPHEASVIPLDSASGTGYENHLEVDKFGRTFGISGLTSVKGQKFGTLYEIPLGPLQNFSQLNSANVAATHSLARFAYPIGNSWAHPMIKPDGIANTAMPGSLDHSFLLNSLLFDRYYFSGIAPRAGSFVTGVTTEALAKSFYEGEEKSLLTDKRLLPYLPDGETEKEALDALSVASAADATKPQARYLAAAHQLMKGAFNVNSTSKEAWKAMLASLHAPQAKMFKADATQLAAAVTDLKPAPDGSARFSRFLLPNGDAPETAADTQQVFQGPRDLDSDQLDRLAEEIVEQVRLRGPFLSMAEFVNRQLGSSELAQKGALQAAIDATDINSDQTVLADTGYVLPDGSAKYANPKAMAGRSDQGAPGYLTQADLLAVLGNAATVRSDTFTVRAYGEARDKEGKVISRAWCEAVVQRLPEYLASADKSQIAPAELTSEANKTFGRRFVVRSFRWVPSQEILPAA